MNDAENVRAFAAVPGTFIEGVHASGGPVVMPHKIKAVNAAGIRTTQGFIQVPAADRILVAELTRDVCVWCVLPRGGIDTETVTYRMFRG